MAKEKNLIVIKKIIVAGGGHHGGSWKVALADFMTAMMAFFLVMWLLNQTEETKKAVSDYFSTPSVIEYNFQNFGAELTLEKLFLDLVNEPLKAMQSFMEPIDRTPNLLDMGSAKVVAAQLADQLSDYAKNVSVTPNGFDFDIPDNLLFERGSSNPIPMFIEIMDKVNGVTTGLEEAEIKINSALFVQTVPDMQNETAKRIASQRLDLVSKKIQSSLEHNTVSVSGSINVREKKGEYDPSKLIGFIKISIQQKEIRSDGKQVRKLDTMFGESRVDMNVYDNFVQQLSNSKKKKEAESK
ncbi:MAG: flagellar motor protein MotB [Bdellovibrionota bacterium]